MFACLCSWHGRSSFNIPMSRAMPTSTHKFFLILAVSFLQIWILERKCAISWNSIQMGLGYCNNLTKWAELEPTMMHLYIKPRAGFGIQKCLILNPWVWVWYWQLNNQLKPNSSLDSMNQTQQCFFYWKNICQRCGLLVALWHQSATPSRITSSQSMAEVGGWINR